MALNFFMGGSGHGKTYTLYNRIIKEAQERPDTEFIIIVPEQSSLQAQKDVVSLHPLGGVFNIDILTFGRLCYRVFDELCITPLEIIDDMGKNLIIRKIIDDPKVKKELKIIKPIAAMGFVSELKSAISELKQYGITREAFEELAERIGKQRTRDKISDLALIYGKFNEYISNRFITAEDKQDILLSHIGESQIFKNAVVAFDGFTGFTPVQMKTITRILEMASEVYVNVTLPISEAPNILKDEQDLFFMSKDMLTGLSREADRLGIRTNLVKLTTNEELYRFRNSEELAFLEEEIYRYSGHVFDKPTKDIFEGVFENEEEEVRYAASVILKNIRDRKLKFRDFAIITGGISEYSAYIDSIFNECGIPHFIDSKRELRNNPLTSFIRKLLKAAEKDFFHEAVTELAKNPFCGFCGDDVDIFENYLLKYGISGHRKWKEPFIYKSANESQKKSIDEIREKLYGMVAPLYELTTGKKTCGEYVLALYSVLENVQVYEKLQEMAETLSEDNPAVSDEYLGTYEKVVELLDRIYNLLGDEVLPFTDFAQIVDAGINELKLGIIPPGVDMVTVGDIQRTRLEHVKILIVLGMNEGLIPQKAKNKGIINDSEKNELLKLGTVLSPTVRQQIYIQKYYMYLNLTKPDTGLYLFRHHFDREGKSVRISSLLEQIKEMFPKLSLFDTGKVEHRLLNREATKHMVLELLSKPSMSGKEMSLVKYYLKRPEYADYIRKAVFRAEEDQSTIKISEQVLKELYSENGTISVSRIEEFAKCSYKYFAQYGLRLAKRDEFTIDKLDYGNEMHEIIKTAFENIAAERKQLNLLNRDEISEHVKKAADYVFLQKYKYSISSFSQYIADRLVKIAQRTLIAISKQLNDGFVPTYFEKKFERTVSGVPIEGKIDRIDIKTDENGKENIRIIDYKSSEKSLSKEDIYTGINLQLMVYLDSIIEAEREKGGNAGAADALYSMFGDPFIKAEELANDDIERPKSLEPKGFKSSSKVTSQEGLEKVAKDAVKIMVKLAGKIKSGDVCANPVKDACDYCLYKGLCGFNLKTHSYRVPEKIIQEEDLEDGVDQ